jgi:hypothetical protein
LGVAHAPAGEAVGVVEELQAGQVNHHLDAEF